MLNIALNVTDEEQLYNSLDPQRDLLNDEVKGYLLKKVQIEGPVDGVNLELRSTAAIDKASIWIIQNLKLRLRRHAVSRLKEGLTLRFSVCDPDGSQQ